MSKLTRMLTILWPEGIQPRQYDEANRIILAYALSESRGTSREVRENLSAASESTPAVVANERKSSVATRGSIGARLLDALRASARTMTCAELRLATGIQNVSPYLGRLLKTEQVRRERNTHGFWEYSIGAMKPAAVRGRRKLAVTPKMQEMLEVLRAHPEGLTPPEIAKLLRTDIHIIHSRAWEMRQRKFIVAHREKKGTRYLLPAKASGATSGIRAD